MEADSCSVGADIQYLPHYLQLLLGGRAAVIPPRFDFGLELRDKLSKCKFNEGGCAYYSERGLNVVLEKTREEIFGLR